MQGAKLAEIWRAILNCVIIDSAKAIFDNFAINNSYGFNIDSLNKDALHIWFNEVRNPSSYGIVVGGPAGQFSNFDLIYNTISDSVTAIVLAGNVTNAIIGRNNIVTDQVTVITPDGGNPYLQGPNGTGFWVFRSGNMNNNIQYNQISQFCPAVLSAPSAENQNCAYSNWQENGAVSYTAWWDPLIYFPPAIPSLPATAKQPCISWL